MGWKWAGWGALQWTIFRVGIVCSWRPLGCGKDRYRQQVLREHWRCTINEVVGAPEIHGLRSAQKQCLVNRLAVLPLKGVKKERPWALLGMAEFGPSKKKGGNLPPKYAQPASHHVVDPLLHNEVLGMMWASRCMWPRSPLLIPAPWFHKGLKCP